MKIENGKIQRLAIYFFYDPDGIVDRYALYMLDEVKKNVSDLLIVCNGKLSSEGRAAFEKITSRILVRENSGFDVWAYKEAMDFWGWKNLIDLDELILMNSTIMGPLYPLSDMFHEMNSRDVDFWGITSHSKINVDPFGKIKYGYIPTHLQSHFIAIRSHMLRSTEFKFYWDHLPQISTYEDSIAMHEVIFTKDFENKGFTWAAYVDTTDMEKYVYNPMTLAPLEMVKARKCPIFKRRNFFHNYNEYLQLGNGESTRELFEYIRDHTNYDVDLIWENILRTQHMADIKNSLHLDYVIPSMPIQKSTTSKSKSRIALVMHIFFTDQIEYCYRYAQSMPADSDVYITTDSESKKIAILKVFQNLLCHKMHVMIIENRGRDVSALLVAMQEFIMDYDLVCFVHDKKVGQLDWSIKGEEFSKQCFDNLLQNSTFVENLIEIFAENPRLGLLVPPPPGFGDYYFTHGYSWGPNYEVTHKLWEDLSLQIPISPEKEPIAPLGTMFWFRSKALKLLFDKNWKYSDFPKEPNRSDGTILHAIERIYPFVAQQEGYYSAWSFSENFAQTQLTNLEFMLSEINKRAFQLFGMNSHHGLITSMELAIFNGGFTLRKNRAYRSIINLMKRVLPPRLFGFLKSIYNTQKAKRIRNE